MLKKNVLPNVGEKCLLTNKEICLKMEVPFEVMCFYMP